MSSLVSFSGLASGIDSSSLIQALLDSERTAKINPLQTRIQTLDDSTSALTELKGLLQKLSTAAGKLRSVNGTVLNRTALSSNENVLSATASSSAPRGNYSITVSALASNGVHTQSDAFSSTDQVVNASMNTGTSDADRTLTYTIGTGAEQETVGIVLTDTTTVSDIVTQFNEGSNVCRERRLFGHSQLPTCRDLPRGRDREREHRRVARC